MNRFVRLQILETIMGYLQARYDKKMNYENGKRKAHELYGFLNYAGGGHSYSGIASYSPIGFLSSLEEDLDAVMIEISNLCDGVENSFTYTVIDNLFDVELKNSDVYVVSEPLTADKAHWFHSHLSNLTLESEVNNTPIPVFIFINVNIELFNGLYERQYVSKIKLFNNNFSRGAA